MKARFLVLVIVLGLVSVPVSADRITLNPGDLFEIRFTIVFEQGHGPGPIDAIRLDFSGTDRNLGEPPTILSGSLFNGNTLLGTDSRLPFGESDSQTDFSFGLFWRSATSQFTAPQPTSSVTVIDFTSIADGTIDGLLQLSILSGGSFEFDPTAPLGSGPIQILVGVGGPNSISIRGHGVVSELTLNGESLPTSVPEPATLTLLAAGLIAGAAFRKRFHLR